MEHLAPRVVHVPVTCAQYIGLLFVHFAVCIVLWVTNKTELN